MFKILSALVATIVATALMSACSTLSDARSAKGTGMSREYAAAPDAVWKALPKVLSELAVPVVSENRTEGVMLAQRGMTAFSYGENVAVFVDAVNGGSKTRVEVVSKKSMATNVFAPDWAKDILDRLDEKLK